MISWSAGDDQLSVLKIEEPAGKIVPHNIMFPKNKFKKSELHTSISQSDLRTNPLFEFPLKKTTTTHICQMVISH